MTVDGLDHFAVFNPGRAMPRLHDELIAGLDVAKDDDFVINGVGDGDDFADGGHPAAHEAVEHPSPIYRVAQIGSDLHWMISASVAAIVNRRDIVSLNRADERGPTCARIGYDRRARWRSRRG